MFSILCLPGFHMWRKKKERNNLLFSTLRHGALVYCYYRYFQLGQLVHVRISFLVPKITLSMIKLCLVIPPYIGMGYSPFLIPCCPLPSDTLLLSPFQWRRQDFSSGGANMEGRGKKKKRRAKRAGEKRVLINYS